MAAGEPRRRVVVLDGDLGGYSSSRAEVQGTHVDDAVTVSPSTIAERIRAADSGVAPSPNQQGLGLRGQDERDDDD